MQQKTKGVVIQYIKYRETSILVSIYTKSFGICSFIENGVRSAKGKHKMALFQPLNLLDLDIYYQPNKGLQRISEAKCFYPFQEIPYKIHKSSIALFLGEVLHKVLKEEEKNEALFDFLQDSIIHLDELKVDFENFHLKFLWDLSGFLGFYPSSIKQFFEQLSQLTNRYAIEEISPALEAIVSENHFFPISRTHRRDLLNALLDFYTLHMESFKEVKSLAILQEVLS